MKVLFSSEFLEGPTRSPGVPRVSHYSAPSIWPSVPAMNQFQVMFLLQASSSFSYSSWVFFCSGHLLCFSHATSIFFNCFLVLAILYILIFQCTGDGYTIRPQVHENLMFFVRSMFPCSYPKTKSPMLIRKQWFKLTTTSLISELMILLVN